MPPKGAKLSLEARLKISHAKKGKKLPPFSEEHKKRIGEANRGKTRSAKQRMAESEMRLGEKNPRWIGGCCQYHHKQARIIMEKHLGRPLSRGEVIHHIDGNWKNNDITNLELTCQSKHVTTHNYQRGALKKAGLNSFHADYNP